MTSPEANRQKKNVSYELKGEEGDRSILVKMKFNSKLNATIAFHASEFATNHMYRFYRIFSKSVTNDF